MKHYFVSGIGTSVGKTLAAAVLTEALNADYWKPVQTGPMNESDRGMITSLISNSKSICFKEAYWFKEPASPHLAASLEKQTINLEEIALPASTNRHLIIEGAGGLLVPLNRTDFVIDLAKHLDSEVILVCRNYLGCINHTLLSIDYLLRNNFKIKGLVLNGNFDPLVKGSILNYAETPLLAEFPELATINKETVLQLSKTVNLNLF